MIQMQQDRRLTVRGMNILQEQGLTVRILPIPGPYDPDSFLRQKGREKFLEVLEKLPLLLTFNWNYLSEIMV